MWGDIHLFRCIPLSSWLAERKIHRVLEDVTVFLTHAKCELRKIADCPQLIEIHLLNTLIGSQQARVEP